MNTHQNARLTPAGRQVIVQRALGGMPVAEVARGARVSARTVWKWLARYDEYGRTAAQFLTRALAWFRAHGLTVTRVLSDNGGCYRSAAHRAAVYAHRLTHRFTRPYRPQTNGEAERFIRTLLAEWAYAEAYRTSQWRTTALPRHLTYYNTARRHSAHGRRPPITHLSA